MNRITDICCGGEDTHREREEERKEGREQGDKVEEGD